MTVQCYAMACHDMLYALDWIGLYNICVTTHTRLFVSFRSFVRSSVCFSTLYLLLYHTRIFTETFTLKAIRTRFPSPSHTLIETIVCEWVSEWVFWANDWLSSCLSLTRARALYMYTTSLSTSFKRSTFGWWWCCCCCCFFHFAVCIWVNNIFIHIQILYISLFGDLFSIHYKSFFILPHLSFSLSVSRVFTSYVYVRCIGARATMDFLLRILWLNSSQPHTHTHT